MKIEYHKTDISQEPQTGAGSIFPPGADGSPALPGGCSPLPCLYSNISTEMAKQQAICELASAVLSPYYKRSAHTLYANVMRLAGQTKSIGFLAFVTLTFARNVRDHLEASRCWDSCNTHWFGPNPDYGLYINTKELQEKRRKVWHYHMIVQVGEDIKEGFDFPAFREWLKGNNRFKRPCPTGSPYFRRLWDELIEAVQRYGFGKIASIEPIESTEEAVSRYIGGYIGKTIGRRTEQEKGARLVNYPKGWTRNSPKFQWNTKNSAEWRKKVSLFAKIHGCQDLYQLSDKLGSNWAYRYLDDIINVYEIAGDHFEQFKHENEQKINRETGEITSNLHEDRIFKRITENDRTKTQLLHAEVLGLITPKATYQHWQKTQRKKQESKIYIEQSKTEYTAFREWLKKLPEAPF